MMIRSDGLCKQFDRTVLDKDDGGSKKKLRGAKSRRESFYAVDHVSFEVGEGEIVGILGPNGAGKTTLLRMMGCLMQPSGGRVVITDPDGSVITDPVEQKRRIGYLSGNTRLYHRLSVREMLRMLAEIYGIDRQEADARIESISKVLDMDSFIDNRIERLSTGQTQRASISRCLIHQPDIYIFDEPTLGLDILSADAIVSFMKSQKEEGKTVLYSTHYLEEAQFLCDRVIMISGGKILCEDSPEAIMEMTKTESLRDAFHVMMKGLDAGESGDAGENAGEKAVEGDGSDNGNDDMSREEASDEDTDSSGTA